MIPCKTEFELVSLSKKTKTEIKTLSAFGLYTYVTSKPLSYLAANVRLCAAKKTFGHQIMLILKINFVVK